MREVLNVFCQQLWSRYGLDRETVSVAACVHYGGFRYGRGEYHPYETYLVDMLRDGNTGGARQRLLDFLRHYRPRDFGSALGVRLRTNQPIWRFPWSRAEPAAAWVERLADCPDILTHFLERGVPLGRLRQEFGWLEGALESVRRNGYQPGRFKNTVLARKLIRSDGGSAYLLLDGNHRVASLAALGVREVTLTCPPWLAVWENRVATWPQVRRGLCPADDARQIFRAYFLGNAGYRTTESTAPIWEESA